MIDGSPVAWSSQASPFGVLLARATIDGAAAGSPPAEVLVVTEGGVTYRRRREGAQWRWERLGAPPGGSLVRDLACVVTGPAGSVSPVVVADADRRMWLGSPSVPTTWTELGRPEADPGMLSARSFPDATGRRHYVAVAGDSGSPWLRESFDPDGTWSDLAHHTDWHVGGLSFAAASDGAGAAPVPHVFALTHGPDGSDASLRVAVRSGAVWTWVDPGQPPGGLGLHRLSTASVEDGSGTVAAAALVSVLPRDVGGAGPLWMLMGSGGTWRWEEVGRPPGAAGTQSAVLATAGPQHVASGEPVVVASSDGHLWRWARREGWVDLGGVPGGTVVVEPGCAFDVSIATDKRLWAVGAGRDASLWTVEVEGTTARWENHGSASAVRSIVGAYTDPPSSNGAGRLGHQHVIDGAGRLWRSTQAELFNPAWEELGQPAPTVVCRGGVGALSVGDVGAQRAWAFVTGSDGHLWAHTRAPSGEAWVDHGMPAGRGVRATLPPMATGPASQLPCVPVVTDDGELWLRAAGGAGWGWEDRATPPGRRVMELVGGGVVGAVAARRPTVAVVADDGHLWLNGPGAGATSWRDLGSPPGGEDVGAGIGTELTADSVGGGMTIAVAGASSGRVWIRAWSPGERATWVGLGGPGGERIHAGAGVIRDPRVPGGSLVFVIGGDRQLWAHTGAEGRRWERWGLPRGADALDAGQAVVLEVPDVQPVVMLLAVDRRLWMATPRA